MPIGRKDIELMGEIKDDPLALRLLKDKCKWEQMGMYAVLQEWGDPREWATYKRKAGA